MIICIKVGYEPVVHINTIAETVKLEWLDKEYLKAGEKWKSDNEIRI